MIIKGAFPIRWKPSDGTDGKNAIRLDLDNENDSILIDSAMNIIGTYPNTTARLYDGSTKVTSGITWSCVASGVEVEESVFTTTGEYNVEITKVTAKSGLSVTISAIYKGVTYKSIMTLTVLEGVDKYELVCTPNSVTYNTSTKTASEKDVKVQVYKTAQNGTRELLQTLPTGYSIKFVQSGQTSENIPSTSYANGYLTITNLLVDTYDYYTILLKDNNGKVLDSETIPILKGKDGADGAASIRLDLDNEFDSIIYSSSGKMLGSSVVTNIHVYEGEKEITGSVTSEIAVQIAGGSCIESTIKDDAGNKIGKRVTVDSISSDADEAVVTVTLTHSGTVYTAVFTVKKLVGVDKYDLSVTPSAIAYNSTTKTASSSNMVIRVYKTDANGVRTELESLTADGLTLEVKKTVGSTSSSVSVSYGTGGATISSLDMTASHYAITLKKGTAVMDTETVPINKSADGADGEKGDTGSAGNGIASHTISFAITTKPVAPDASSSEWVLSTASNCPKEGTKYKPYLWHKEVITYTQDTSLNKTIIRLVSVYNLDTRPQMLRQTAFDNEDAMDKWTAKLVNIVADTAASNAVSHKAASTENGKQVLNQYVFTVGGEAIIKPGKYYTMSFYMRTRMTINQTLTGSNTGSIKVWLAAGSYKLEASMRLNKTSATNGKSAFVKARYNSSANSDKDRTVSNSSPYDKRVSTSDSNPFTVDTDGEYQIMYGQYKEGATYSASEKVTINWIRIVPTTASYNYSVNSYLGVNGCTDKTDNNIYSDAFKDGVLLSKGGDIYGGASFYPISDTEDMEDENGWVRHWQAYRMKDDVNNWHLSNQTSVTTQLWSLRAMRIPYFEIKHPKLEEGVMPTEWCEHKDDDTMQCSHNPCGTWSPVGTYYYCRGQRDVVKYYTDSNKSDMTWWRMKKRTSKAGYTNINPPYTDTAHWETSNKLKFTIVDTMFSEEIFTDKLTVGKLLTSNNNGHIEAEGGVLKVYGKANALPQIVIGADENGNAVLSIYDNTGGKVWDLSVNGLKGIDIIEMKMTEAKYYKVASHAQGASLTNTQLTAIVTAVTSGSELTSYYQFSCKKQMNNGVVMAYYYGDKASSGVGNPPSEEGKYYTSSSTNATTLLPTETLMPTGLYTQKTQNHYMTMPDETTGISLYRCSLIRVNSGVFSAGNRYIEWKSDKSYIHLVDGAKEYTYGSL